MLEFVTTTSITNDCSGDGKMGVPGRGNTVTKEQGVMEHGALRGTGNGKSGGWPAHWPCGGSAEIRGAHAGDHRKEDHVQGLFPRALVLLALLSKEEWKL